MYWVTQLVVAIWATANNFAWYAVDPVASFALAHANCSFLTPSCLQQAKAIAVQVIAGQTGFYWCGINEEIARLEHERKEKEAHDEYIAQQLVKADKWDGREVSPPTIIHQTTNNFINPTVNSFVHPTFISVCTPPPQIPGLDAKALAIKHRPTMGSEFGIDDGSLEEAISDAWMKQYVAFDLFVLAF